MGGSPTVLPPRETPTLGVPRGGEQHSALRSPSPCSNRETRGGPQTATPRPRPPLWPPPGAQSPPPPAWGRIPQLLSGDPGEREGGGGRTRSPRRSAPTAPGHLGAPPRFQGRSEASGGVRLAEYTDLLAGLRPAPLSGSPADPPITEGPLPPGFPLSAAARPAGRLRCKHRSPSSRAPPPLFNSRPWL